MPIGTAFDQAVYTPGCWRECNGLRPCGDTVPRQRRRGHLPEGRLGLLDTANARALRSWPRPARSRATSTRAQGNSALINDNAWANYNGMIATLQHRLSSTFSIMANYTWSRCMNVSDAGGDIGGNGPMNPSASDLTRPLWIGLSQHLQHLNGGVPATSARCMERQATSSTIGTGSAVPHSERQPPSEQHRRFGSLPDLDRK